MRKTRSYVTLCAVVLLYGSLGCDQLMYGFSGYPRSPRYAIGFYNGTGDELTHVHANWSAGGRGYMMPAGMLNIGSVKEFSEAPDPIPAKATVFWTTADGQAHQQIATIASAVPKIGSFTGTIYLKIMPTGVIIDPLTEHQMTEMAAQQKSIP